MPTIDFVIETRISQSVRARQLSSMFDVPPSEKAEIKFKGEFPIEKGDWNVGLIVGPSGCGKSSILRHVFGETTPLQWSTRSVIDDFEREFQVEAIAAVCQAVGFNTIPAWLRPYAVLSNGEKFRVELARRLLETKGDVIVDEFTSVVDRQVAQIGSHAVQKFIRKAGKRFVAASCHYDIADWLQPDWILEPATMTFTRRLLQRRPPLECQIRRVPWDAWRVFAPFHYLTADLHKAARCYGLFVGDRIAAFAGMLYRPHPRVRDVWGCSRLVTLPDFQGLGLAFALIDRVASLYKAQRLRVHTYPAHPALIRGFDRSPVWRLDKRPGVYSPRAGHSSTISAHKGFGGRPCAVFEYAGGAFPDAREASRMIG